MNRSLRQLAFLLAATVMAACTGTATLTPPPAPPAPSAPPGAASLGSFAGAAPGRVGIEIELAGQNVIVHAICDGTGRLFVVPSLVEEASSPARPSGVAIFDCQVPPLDERVELSGLPIGKVSFTAYVVEGPGALRPTVFSVSIEQGTD